MINPVKYMDMGDCPGGCRGTQYNHKGPHKGKRETEGMSQRRRTESREEVGSREERDLKML